MKIEETLQPERNLLLVRKNPETNKLDSGLELPEKCRAVGSASGVVLAAGPLAHPEYEPGRTVYFSPLAGTAIAAEGEEGGQEVLIMGPDDVLALGELDAVA